MRCACKSPTSLETHSHEKKGGRGNESSLSTNNARWRLHVEGCIPAYAHAKTFMTAPPSRAWIAVILSPHAALPDSDGLHTIPSCRFHSKWEFCSIRHFGHNYFQPSLPFSIPSDRQSQPTTLDVFLPVASCFHNMNVLKFMISKLPLGEETSNSSIFFGLLFQFTHEYKEPHE